MAQVISNTMLRIRNAEFNEKIRIKKESELKSLNEIEKIEDKRDNCISRLHCCKYDLKQFPNSLLIMEKIEKYEKDIKNYNYKIQKLKNESA